jgi:membrane protein
VLGNAWTLVKDSVSGFIDDDALSHGAAMAFYAVTSLAPILLIVVAVAGLVFGHDAAQTAISMQLAGLMGQQSADLLRTAIQSAAVKSTGIVASVVGLVTLIATASGVFGQMQAALNAIWKTEPKGGTMSRLVRARIASVGLVAALGFLLMVSLAVSAGISALGDFINAYLPFGQIILSVANTVVSLLLISVLFGAIYKILPDRKMEWRDVMVGAVITAALFTIGKSLIGWYLGSSAVGSAYGAAGALLIVLLWVYYSSVIFLLGAEFTRAYSVRHGSRSDISDPVLEASLSDSPKIRQEPSQERLDGTAPQPASDPTRQNPVRAAAHLPAIRLPVVALLALAGLTVAVIWRRGPSGPV